MQPVRQWWGNILGGLFGGGGGGGGSSGGSSGGGIGGGTYNDGGFSFDGACATGGPVMAGRVYRVNELGIEAFQPAVDGYILNHGQTRSAFGNSSSSSAPPSVQVNITNNTSTAIQEPQVTTRYDEDQRKFVVGVIIDAVNNNTAARNAVRKAANG